MTKEERHLWYDFLNSYPVKFRRQKVFGDYIVDFYCSRARLVLEIDGSQHYEEEGLHNDEKRTRFLNEMGLDVVRILNSEINVNFKGVCAYIDLAVTERLKDKGNL